MDSAAVRENLRDMNCSSICRLGRQ